MNAIRRADVTARVVAWHNRHPLARRIGPDHVGVIGVVVLPFALAPTPPRSGRAEAPAPLFGDDWMYRSAARRLHAWSRRHGAEAPPEGDDWPSRVIDIDPALARAADARGLTARTLRHVLTAAVDADGRRTRVLLAAGGPLRGAAVFGQRLPSGPRQVALAAAGVAVGAWLGAAAWWPPGATPAQATAVAPTVISAQAATGADASVATMATATPPAPAARAGHEPPPANVAPSASAVPSGPTDPGASAPATGTRVAAAAGANPIGAAGVADTGADPDAGAVDRTRDPAPPDAAASVSRAGPDAAAASAPAPAASVVAALAASSSDAGPAGIARPLDSGPVLRLRDDGAPPLVDIRPRLSADERQAARRQAAALRPPPQAIRLDGPVYAIASAPARTRDDALAQQALLQGLLAQSVTAAPTRLDVMATRGRWRAVWWPHPRREDAQALLHAARARGLAVELIAF